MGHWQLIHPPAPLPALEVTVGLEVEPSTCMVGSLSNQPSSCSKVTSLPLTKDTFSTLYA